MGGFEGVVMVELRRPLALSRALAIAVIGAVGFDQSAIAARVLPTGVDRPTWRLDACRACLPGVRGRDPLRCLWLPLGGQRPGTAL